MKNASSKLRPYYLEALLAFGIDFVVIILAWIVFLLASRGNDLDLVIYYVGWFSIIYLIIACLLHYNMAILGFIDQRTKSVKTKEVYVIDQKIESSWSGWQWNSNVGKLYPNKNVERYKIKCIDKNGKKVSFRMVMSCRQFIHFINLFFLDDNKRRASITYLKFSRVVLRIELLDESGKTNKFTKNQSLGLFGVLKNL